MSILSVNAGSSSLKFALYPLLDPGIGAAEVTGMIEGLEPSGQPRMSCVTLTGEKISQPIEHAPDEDVFDAALDALKEVLQTRFAAIPLQAIAHRVVHGGPYFTQSVLVTPQVIDALADLSPLAPLHQPHNLAGIVAFGKAFTHLPQIACFDTAFHRSLSLLETTFAIDRQLTAQGVRRYGFHGLSYQYVCQALQRVSTQAQRRVVMAHLGNGASLCAMTEHQSKATTMGFSALDGLMMGTRSGALDPGVVLYLMEQGWTHDALQNLLYKQSGLLGVSGVSADMRTLRASSQASAKFAIDLFTHRVVREVGALSAVISGLDVLVFTGGIGEHDAALRRDVAHSLAYLGVYVDEPSNLSACSDQIAAIHAPHSRVEVWVVPTDEGRVAAQDALNLL